MSEKIPSKRRSYTREFKMKVLREVEAGKSQAQAAREYQLGESSIYKWRRQFAKYKRKPLLVGARLTAMLHASVSWNAKSVSSPWRMTF
jgi:transposase-like protein